MIWTLWCIAALAVLALMLLALYAALWISAETDRTEADNAD